MLKWLPILWLASVQALAAPANDNFANRAPLTGSNLVFHVDLAGATIEPNELDFGQFPWRGHKQSVWWTYTAPGPGELVLSSSGTAFWDKALFACEGESLESLRLVTLIERDQSLRLQVQAGQQLQIALVTDSTEYTDAILSLRYYPPPPNDRFENRIRVDGQFPVLKGTLLGATHEPSELFGRAIWWEWTAPTNGILMPASDRISGISYSIYEGQPLTEVSYPWQLEAGKKYYLAVRPTDEHAQAFELPQVFVQLRWVSPTNGSRFLVGEPIQVEVEYSPPEGFESTLRMGSPTFANFWLTNVANVLVTNAHPGEHYLVLHFSLSPNDTRTVEFNTFVRVAPRNDLFVDAEQLPPNGRRVEITTFAGASIERFEINNPSRSLWWRWKPAFNGRAVLTRTNVISVEMARGTATNDLEWLQGVSADFGETRVYEVSSERTYYITADSFWADRTGAWFGIELLANAPNDSPGNATPLVFPATVKGTLHGAIGPDGRPAQWWRFTAPTEGTFLVDRQSFSVVNFSRTHLDLYRLTEFGTVESIAYPQSTRELAMAPVSEGQVLFVKASGERLGSTPSDFIFNVEFLPTVTNRLSSAPALLSGIPLSTNIFLGTNANTVWYEWTSPVGGEVAIRILSAGDNSVSVFEPSVGGELVQIGQSTFGASVFSAVAGETYKIRVFSTAPLVFLYLAATEPNNSPPNAAELSLPGGLAAGSFLNASDFDDGSGPRPSLWWRFVPPADGLVRAEALYGFQATIYSQTGDPWVPVPGKQERRLENGSTTDVTLYPVLGSAEYFLRLSTENRNQVGFFSWSYSPSWLTSSDPGTMIFAQYQSIQISLNPAALEVDGGPGLVFLELAGSAHALRPPDYSLTIPPLTPGTHNGRIAAWNNRGQMYELTSFSVLVSPLNDRFAAREIITPGTFGDLFASAPIQGATLETGETSIHPPGTLGSAWWEWTAPVSSKVILQAESVFSDVSGFFSVFTGDSLTQLTLVASGHSNVTFVATQGIQYRIAALRMTNLLQGQVLFRIVPVAPNDDFLDRIVVPFSEGFWVPTSLRGSTLEQNEPAAGAHTASIWWSWMPERDGLLLTSGQVFTGSSLNTLTEVPGSGQYSVKAHQQYSIRSLGHKDAPDRSSFSLQFFDPTPNDSFSNAIPLVGYTARLEGFNQLGSTEVGEPPLPGASVPSASAWWKWTPPADGLAHISETHWTHGIEIFTGTVLTNLTPVEPFPGGYGAVFVRAGTEYYIRWASAPFDRPLGSYTNRIELSRQWPMPNDTFTNRTRLEGNSLVVTGHTAGATLESEPGHNVHGSLWWSWIAPAEGLAVFTTQDRLSIRKDVQLIQGFLSFGTDLSFEQGTYSLHVRAGEEIFITVFRYDSPGAIPFSWSLEFQPRFANDLIASPVRLQGASAIFEANFPLAQGYRSSTSETTGALFWEWTAPFAGKVNITRLDGTPRRMLVHATLAGEVRWFGVDAFDFEAIAGRTYIFQVDGNDYEILHLRLNAEPTQATLGFQNGQLLIDLQNTPEGSLFRLDESPDLRTWHPGPLLQFHQQRLQYQIPPTASPHSFFRLVPLR